MNARISKIIIFVLFTNISNCFFADSVSYEDIGNQIINASGMVVNKKNAESDKTECALNKQEMRTIVYKVLDTLDRRREHKGRLNDALRFLMHDLEIFFNIDIQNSDKTLFAKINHTETIFGEAALAKMLISPMTDTILLEARQELVKELLNNEQLFNEIDRLLKEIKPLESDILSFWQEQSSISQSTIKLLYYGGNKPTSWNKNSVALEVLTRWENLNVAWQLFGDVISQAAASYMFNNHMAKFSTPVSVKESLVSALRVIYDPTYCFREAQEYSSGEKDHYLLELCSNNKLEDARKWAALYKNGQGLSVLPGLFLKYINLQRLYERTQQLIDITNDVHAKMINVGTFIRSVRSVDRCITDNAKLANGLLQHKQLHLLFDDTTTVKMSTEFTRLLALLQTSTFTGTASFFSYTGRVLAVYKLMTIHKNKFAASFEALGELDACMSIAKLYKKYEKERVHFAFARYVERATPYIALNNFWNMHVDPAVVVPNTVLLGAPGKERNMVLTGSNTGGKSTLLKGVAIDILLAQTLGIAPGDDVVLTPFTYFGTSLNIVDNTAQGKSLYQAEVDRASALIKAATKLKRDGGHCCLIMDELFRGTAPEKADKETYECSKRLVALDNTVFILATHFFNYPTRLEEETAGICKNYKIEASIDDNGKIVRTFKLEAGISQNNIAADILRSAFDN